MDKPKVSYELTGYISQAINQNAEYLDTAQRHKDDITAELYEAIQADSRLRKEQLAPLIGVNILLSQLAIRRKALTYTLVKLHVDTDYLRGKY
ncbi:MAG TPA: hypothetical protein VFW90_01535 [Candidatus Saccharimonadales bacterium]|nr:hypothetical protein [Candidatus Saccharimonadales bacterium]